MDKKVRPGVIMRDYINSINVELYRILYHRIDSGIDEIEAIPKKHFEVYFYLMNCHFHLTPTCLAMNIINKNIVLGIFQEGDYVILKEFIKPHLWRSELTLKDAGRHPSGIYRYFANDNDLGAKLADRLASYLYQHSFSANYETTCLKPTLKVRLLRKLTGYVDFPNAAPSSTDTSPITTKEES